MGSFLTVSYTAAFFININPTLELNEVGTETDTGKFKIGDGVTIWTGLPYGFPIPPSGNVHTVGTSVNFGFASALEGDTATTTVPAPWVTEDSVLVVSVIAKFGAVTPADDHDMNEVAVEGITATVGNIVPGVSFDVMAYAPQGTWGEYYINIVGV